MCKGPADPLSTCSTVSHTEAESSLEFASIWFLPTIESLYCVEKKFRTLTHHLQISIFGNLFVEQPVVYSGIIWL